MAETSSRSMTENKTNRKKLASLGQVLQGYMTDDCYTTLYLSVAVQGGVIQDIRLLPVDKKKIVRVD